jgi:hypothetical protein
MRRTADGVCFFTFIHIMAEARAQLLRHGSIRVISLTSNNIAKSC